MKICMTHYAFFPTTGGVESHLVDLGAELVKQGHEVHALVGSVAGEPERSELDGIQVYRTDLMNAEYIRQRKERKEMRAEEVDPTILEEIKKMYADFLKEHKIDVVHGHNFHHFVPEHALALTEFWEKGMPNILTVHEVWSECICEDLLEQAKWDFIITFCKHVTNGILEQAPQLMNIEIVYPGIDVDLFSPANRCPKWSAQLQLEGRPVIIHPARMLPWKGVLYSVAALDIVRREFPDVVLIITDTEDIVDWINELKGYKEQVLRTIQNLGLQNNVITQPFPYTELPWVYNESDVVLYPTIEEEPFGLVPVEAMACAKPVVVTRSGGMVESVVNGRTGFIVEKRDAVALADKILLLLRDKERAARMGEQGRKRAKRHFSRVRMARETLRLYRKAIKWSRERKRAEMYSATQQS